MALKPTIYKFRIALSDFDREYYDSLNLTIALHPSETVERMVTRVLAYCINALDDLVFTKGLSEVDEPDIWRRSLDDKTLLWIDVGEPSIERIKKACRLAGRVKIYCFNSKADVWWSQSQAKISQLTASIYQFNWEHIQSLAALVQRTMDISISITGDSLYVAADSGECEINYSILQDV